MKITVLNGRVTAEAENVKDVQLLIGMGTSVQNKGGDKWKGKHRVKCNYCTGMYKNMKLHVMRKHANTNITSSNGLAYSITH